MAELDDLFSGSGIETTMTFLNDKKAVNSDGIYRIDLTKVKDKKRGYRSVIRLLPNITQDKRFGQSGIEKITHYVDIKNVKELSGWFDSPKNFGKPCDLTNLYYNMQNSKNAILVEKSKCLKFSKKYYSYCLVLEDEQQPELVGKIMIYQYGKTIHEKIKAEDTGEITGTKCNVFDWENGKDFVLLVKEIQTGSEIYPDYKNSTFKPEATSLPIYFEEKNAFKNVPLVDGKIDPKYRQPVVDFLLKREHELEEFEPKELTEEQHSKIGEITNFLTGKASSTYTGGSKASTNDFDVNESDDGMDDSDLFDTKSSGSFGEEDSEEDFFAGL